MALLAWPSAFRPRNFTLSLWVNQRVHGAMFGGSQQAVDLLNDRWMASMTLPVRSHADAAALEAWIASFRGFVNTVGVWHRARVAPRGTLRGTPILETAAAQGADEIVIDATADETLLAGDMLGLDGLLLQVAEDCTANGSGVITVPLVNRLRRAVADAAAVVWDAPTVPMHLAAAPRVVYQPGYADTVDLEFVEAIS